MAIKFEVRFSDNVGDLKKHLAEGLDQIEVTKAGMDKLVKSIGGENIIRAANNYAAALKQIGGAAGALSVIERQTSAERERGIVLIQKAIDKYALLGRTAPTALTDLLSASKALQAPLESNAAATEHLGVSFTKLVSSYVTGQAIIAAVKSSFHALTGFIEDSVDAANEAEKANVQLTAALKAQGTATPSVVKAFDDYAKQLQQTTTFQDDAVKGSEALLVQVGNVMPRDMQKALVAVTNLSAGLGKDLTSSTLLVAKAAEGNTTALKKAGVIIDETKVKAQGFGAVLDAINEKFGGQAVAIAGTYQGRIEQLKNAFNDVQESIGRLITQNATVVGVLGQVAKAFEANSSAIEHNQHATDLVSDSVLLLIKGYAVFEPILGATVKGLGYLAKGFIDAYAASINFAGITDKVIVRLLQLAELTPGVDLSAKIKFFEDDFKELNARYLETKETGNDVLTGAKALSGELAASGDGARKLADDLQKTRGQVVPLTDNLKEQTGVWDKHTQAVKSSGVELNKLAKLLADVRAIDFGSQDIVLPKLTFESADDENAFIQRIKKRTELLEKLRTETERTTFTSQFGNGAIELPTLKFDNRDIEQAQKRVELIKKIQDDIERTTFTSQFGKVGLNEDLASKLKPIDVAPKLLKGFGLDFSKALNSAISGFPAILVKAFTGGGGVGGAFKALGTDFGEKLFGASGSFAAFTKKATGSLSKLFGDTIGGALGSAIPGIGALISPAIAGLGKLFGKIFQTEGKKTNDIRDAFQASFGPHGVGGTLEDLVKGFGRVGLGLSKVQQLLKAGNQKDFQKIVDEFNAATATQKTAFDKLNEATQKWGLSLADLGPQFRAQKIAESADSLYQDFKLLQASGADTATILQHMSGVVISTAEDGSKAVTDWGEGFGNLIHQAMATGTALPKELEPVVQQMIDLGLIVRDDGTKFGSLEETGLSFAGSLSDIIKDDLVPTLKDLAIAIKQGLKIPLSEADQEYLNLRDNLQKPIVVPPVTVDVNYNTTTTGTPPPGGPGPGFGMPGSEDNPNRVWTGGKVLEAGIQHFLGGGRVLQFRSAGSDTVPAMLTPGELVLTASQQRAVGALLEMAPAYQPQAAVDTSQLRATGTDGAIHNHITIHGIDGPSITRVVKSREFADALATQTKHQKYGINRKLKRSTP